jgi:ribonuclease-3
MGVVILPMVDLQRWSRDTLGHLFQHEALLWEALTHTSFANEHQRAVSNERLEFLGDAVLGMIVARFLYEQFPDLPEGELTKIRAAVVCEPTLAARARLIGIGPCLRFGKGETVSGRERDSTLADAFEAVVGALYLDGDFDVARSFVLRELSPLIEEARIGQVRVDYKTRLQEELQRTANESPTYRLLAEEGPAHNKRFQAGVFHLGACLGAGWGRNKKEAEQEAAREAWHTIHP